MRNTDTDTLDLAEAEGLKAIGRVDSSERPLKEVVASLHVSGVVGLALWPRPGFLGLLFDLR